MTIDFSSSLIPISVVSLLTLLLMLLTLTLTLSPILVDTIELNYKLFLISSAGLIYLDPQWSSILENMTSDPILIKLHRKLLNKNRHNGIIRINIGFTPHHYVLDPNLAKQVLLCSPKFFSAGKAKHDLFIKIMPNNVGISTGEEWCRRREFNECVLGARSINSGGPLSAKSDRLLTAFRVIDKRRPPLNIDDFRSLSFDIAEKMIFGEKNGYTREFISMAVNDIPMFGSPFFKQYTDYLVTGLNRQLDLECKHDLEENVVSDQVPHWFSPFIFISTFLIPNFLCVILSFPEVHQKVLECINSEDFDIYSKRNYLHYCTIEHIRLFNTININIQRTANQDLKLGSTEIKRGDQLFILFSSILRDESQFVEPDQFIPTRWIERSLSDQDIVFGVGPQQCPSRQITPVFYKLFISTLLRIHNYGLVYPQIKDRNLYFINPFTIKFR